MLCFLVNTKLFRHNCRQQLSPLVYALRVTLWKMIIKHRSHPPTFQCSLHVEMATSLYTGYHSDVLLTHGQQVLLGITGIAQT